MCPGFHSLGTVAVLGVTPCTVPIGGRQVSQRKGEKLQKAQAHCCHSPVMALLCAPGAVSLSLPVTSLPMGSSGCSRAARPGSFTWWNGYEAANSFGSTQQKLPTD